MIRIDLHIESPITEDDHVMLQTSAAMFFALVSQVMPDGPTIPIPDGDTPSDDSGPSTEGMN